MSVSGLCELCGTGEVERRCERCGRLACRDCWNRDAGACVECAAELNRTEGRVEREDDSWDDGVDVNRL